MKQWVTAFFGIALLTCTALAAGTGPEIRIVDDKVSMQAQSMPLGRLLHLFDLATGMNSKVPPELASRIVSVEFSDLDVGAAVQKIFEGQMLDYVFFGGHGIIVTAVSQAARPGAVAPPPAFDSQPGFIPDQPFTQDFPGPGGIAPGAPGAVNPFNVNPFNNNANGNNPNVPGNQAQPAVIQTPFGPIPNPRLNQNQPVAPAAGQGGVVAPFGGATPFGQPAAPANPFAIVNPNAGTTSSSPGILPSAISPAPLTPK